MLSFRSSDPAAGPGDVFAEEIFLSAQRRARLGAGVGFFGLCIALVSVSAVAMLAPLKERVPVVILMDPVTGKAEQIAEVQALSLDEQEAVIQANLVSYVTDRETFEAAGAQERVNSVNDRSIEQAGADFVALWSPGHPDYPPERFTQATRVTVKIRSIAILNETTAQVRFTKTLTAPRTTTTTASFVATIAFEFQAGRGKVRRIEDVWANPLGFKVKSYRVDAETLDRGN